MTGHKAQGACIQCYGSQQRNSKVTIFSSSGLEPTPPSQEPDTAVSLWQKVTFQQPASKMQASSLLLRQSNTKEV